MPAYARKVLLAGALALALAGCGNGDGGTIPADNATAMLNHLDETEEQIRGGDCGAAVAQAESLVEEVNALPAEAGVETKEGLRDAAINLVALARESSACVEDGITEEEPTTTDTTTTETTETTTDTDDTTETTTTDTDEEDGEEDGEEEEEVPPTETETEPPTDGEPTVGGEGEGEDGGPPSGGVGGEKR